MKYTGDIVAAQRRYFLSGKTKPYEARMEALDRLMSAIRENEVSITRALKNDFNKPPVETYMTEIGIALDELKYHRKRLGRWMKDRRVTPTISQSPGRCVIMPEPYGCVLIISPWNYPFQLCIDPLIGAISAGNCAVVKPSAYAPETSRVIYDMLSKAFPAEFIAVVLGGRAENAALLKEKFDYIFFTGSPDVGHVVMEAASKHLTPVTLELGGKSPVIVDDSADIRLAAKRVAFGKVLNAGQTCVAPDYLLLHRSVKEEFIAAYREALSSFFPDGDMSDMAVIISDKHYKRVAGLMECGRAEIGGGCDPERRFIEPTLLTGVSEDSRVMSEEIFGPLLPVMEYETLDECISFIVNRPKPLALYLFTRSKETERRVFGACSFGGGCVNDVIMHLASSRMPFGGVGASGMGSYHGRASFDTFTHYRSVLKSGSLIDVPLRYRPYTERTLNLIRKVMK